MHRLSQLFRSRGGARGHHRATRPSARPARPRFQPALESLEDRAVPTTSSIISNFNSTAIPAGDSVWFSSVAKVSGVPSTGAVLHVANQSITSADGSINVPVPDTTLTLSPSTTTVATDFGGGSWATSAPAALSGNVFLGGVGFKPAGGLPGGIKNVTWQGQFWTDTPGIKISWKWAAAVYSSFSTDNNALSVKPVDSNSLSAYTNSDHAGTPEAFKAFVLGGARGGGGSNYTGGYSGTATVIPVVDNSSPGSDPGSGPGSGPASSTPPAPASISGYVYVDNNYDEAYDDGDTGIGGVQLTLTGTDYLGHSVSITTTTDQNGLYSFSGLAAGSYMINEPVTGFIPEVSNVGTVNGSTSPDGTVLSDGSLAQVVLRAGSQGTNYDFGYLPPF